jgi:integrase
MLTDYQQHSLLVSYFKNWVTVYKEGAVRLVTLQKYHQAQAWLEKLVPTLMLSELDRSVYQQLLNDYATVHEHQTTVDFHHHIKGAILDAVDEGLIPNNPTRKAIIKGKAPRDKKLKYLNQFELHELLAKLNLSTKINNDWLILLIAKTGLRYSEALAITPNDFDFVHQTVSVNKTWNYKNDGGFQPTKNSSSNRKVRLDWQTMIQFSQLVSDLPLDKPIFVNGNVYNSTANNRLSRICKIANVPEITIHGLRHTHASLLLYAGVSIASVSRRLGHSNMTTTEKIYLHVIQELDNQDTDIVMRYLSGLC